MTDPVALTTVAGAGAQLDPGLLVGVAVALLAAFGAPWWVGPLVRVGAAVILRRGASDRVEAPQPPVSDGGSAEDEARRASAPAEGQQKPPEPTDGMG